MSQRVTEPPAEFPDDAVDQGEDPRDARVVGAVTRITRHYDIELIPAFDIEGTGTIHIAGTKVGKLAVALLGRDTPEQVGIKIGRALRLLEHDGVIPPVTRRGPC